MGRLSAAEKAKREMEAEQAKLKAQENGKGSENGAGGDSNGASEEGAVITQEVVNEGAGGDSSGDSNHSDEEDANQFAVEAKEEEKVHAVALRDLPGVGVKIGQIVKAPAKLIKSWDEVSWIDTHENALAAAEQAYTQKRMAMPHFNEPKIIELDDKGQIMPEVFEG